MKKIFRHIEYLLLEHAHVIIPQLGGFVAKSMPGVWSEDEELFLPPYRTVHFNAHMNHGDTTLVDSLSAAYSITPSEAEKWCAQFVQGIHMELAENGSLDFGSIGVMIQESPEQPITFSPCKAGVTTPELYGLDAFHMPKLAHGTFAQPRVKVAEKGKTTRHYTLQLNRHLVHTVATLAASIILFVLFSTPIETPVQHLSQTNQAELFIPTHLISRLNVPVAEPAPNVVVKEEPLAEQPVAVQPVVAQPVKEAPKAEVPKEKAAPAPAANVTAKQNGFAIVLASAISQTNAENYAKDLQARGYDAHVYQHGKMVRVIIPCYDGEQKTREKLNQMKKSGNEFKQAWITPLK